jgi:hypothetical protein
VESLNDVEKAKYESPAVAAGTEGTMNNYFSDCLVAAGASCTAADVHFDAWRDTPELIEALRTGLPMVGDLLEDLRTAAVPLMPSSEVGSFGNFRRLPNHYRSVCLAVPGSDGEAGGGGVIAFKGTEPLLPDFPQYLDWMLAAQFRSSYLPLGLHFPLEMKLPPGAMWIEECVLEQRVTSAIQRRYLARHGRLARLPLPLFVFQFTAEQTERYRQLVRHRLSPGAFSRIEAKVADGLGVEVYYYPGAPLRAADLVAMDLNDGLRAMLTADALEATFTDWIQLMADLLALGYMPYAPWNHGMGAYVDPGNACIDGGFNDLLTIVAFDSMPNEDVFWRGLGQSIQMLASSAMAMCTAATGTRPPLQSEPVAAIAYVTEGLRERIRAEHLSGADLDPRLVRFFERPSVEDLFRQLRDIPRAGRPVQYRRPDSREPPPLFESLAAVQFPADIGGVMADSSGETRPAAALQH